MKKASISIILALMMVSFTMAQQQETRKVDGFSGIAFGVSGKLIVTQGSSFSVVLEGNPGVLENIRTEVEGNRLYIRSDKWLELRDNRITARVTLPEIDYLAVSGSGDLFCESNISSGDMEIKVSGSGNIEIPVLKADEVEIKVSGSGNVEVGGDASTAEIAISGSGKIDAREFRVAGAEISISGSGRCYVWAEKSLESRISGSGDLYYRGDPNIDSRASGSGSLRKL